MFGSTEPDEIHEGNSAGSGSLIWAAKFLGAEENALTHDLAGLEFYGGTGRNNDIMLGFVGIATDAGFCEADLENSEVAQLDITTSGKCICNTIQGHLDDTEDLLLSECRFFADLHYQISFGEVGHMN